LTGTSGEFLAWGGGAHGCPGRFYAAMLLKVIFAQLLLNCEFKLKDGSGRRPDNMHFGISRLPDISAPIVFRRYEGGPGGGVRGYRLKMVILLS
jgi:cytochrome P450